MRSMDTTSNNSGTGWFALLRPFPDPGSSRPSLAGVIERIRRRWRMRLLLDGLLWTLLLSVLVVATAAWLVNAWHFEPGAVWALRLVTLGTLLALIYWFCLRPLQRQVDDIQVAQYLEEHSPELKSIMLSAVDAQQANDAERSRQLVEQLEARALEACAQIEFGDRVERDRHPACGARLGMLSLVILVLGIWPPVFLYNGVPALLQFWASTSEVSPYQISLSPGDIEIARGADQVINADIAGFDGDDVKLWTSDDGGTVWRENEMTSSSDGLYQGFLFDVAKNTDYYVTGAGRQTSVYRVSVIEIPAVESIGLLYHFPAYTMLPPQSVDDTGDIDALRGTRVKVNIVPTTEIPGGTLELGDGRRIDLQRNAAGTWTGEIVVQDNDSYQVVLQRKSGAPVEILPEYRITALEDQYPRVSITSPGRDTKVSMIEEPVLRVRASDDQGIANLELIISVNGGEEQRIALMPAGTGIDSTDNQAN